MDQRDHGDDALGNLYVLCLTAFDEIAGSSSTGTKSKYRSHWWGGGSVRWPTSSDSWVRRRLSHPRFEVVLLPSAARTDGGGLMQPAMKGAHSLGRVVPRRGLHATSGLACCSAWRCREPRSAVHLPLCTAPPSHQQARYRYRKVDPESSSAIPVPAEVARTSAAYETEKTAGRLVELSLKNWSIGIRPVNGPIQTSPRFLARLRRLGHVRVARRPRYWRIDRTHYRGSYRVPRPRGAHAPALATVSARTGSQSLVWFSLTMTNCSSYR